MNPFLREYIELILQSTVDYSQKTSVCKDVGYFLIVEMAKICKIVDAPDMLMV